MEECTGIMKAHAQCNGVCRASTRTDDAPRASTDNAIINGRFCIRKIDDDVTRQHEESMLNGNHVTRHASGASVVLENDGGETNANNWPSASESLCQPKVTGYRAHSDSEDVAHIGSESGVESTNDSGSECTNDTESTNDTVSTNGMGSESTYDTGSYSDDITASYRFPPTTPPRVADTEHAHAPIRDYNLNSACPALVEEATPADGVDKCAAFNHENSDSKRDACLQWDRVLPLYKPEPRVSAADGVLSTTQASTSRFSAGETPSPESEAGGKLEHSPCSDASVLNRENQPRSFIKECQLERDGKITTPMPGRAQRLDCEGVPPVEDVTMMSPDLLLSSSPLTDAMEDGLEGISGAGGPTIETSIDVENDTGVPSCGGSYGGPSQPITSRSGECETLTLGPLSSDASENSDLTLDLPFSATDLLSTPLEKDSSSIMSDNPVAGEAGQSPVDIPVVVLPDDDDSETGFNLAKSRKSLRRLNFQNIEIHTTEGDGMTSQASGENSSISILLTQCQFVDGNAPTMAYMNPMMLSPPGYPRSRGNSVISIMAVDTLETLQDAPEGDSDAEYHSTYYSNASSRRASIFAILDKWKNGVFQRDKEDVEGAYTPTASVVSRSSALSRTNLSLFALLDKWKSGLTSSKDEKETPETDNGLDISFLMPSRHLIDENPVVLDHIEGKGFPLPGSKKDTVKQIQKTMRKQLVYGLLRNLSTYAFLISCIAILVLSSGNPDFREQLVNDEHVALLVILGITFIGFLAQIVHVVAELRGNGEKSRSTIIFQMLQSAMPKAFFEQTLRKRQLLSPYLSVELQLRKGAKIVGASPMHWTQSATKTTTSLAYRGWADRSQCVHEFPWKSCGQMADWVIVNKDYRTTTRQTLASVEADMAEFLENTDYHAIMHYVNLNYILDVDQGEWFPDAQAHLVFPRKMCFFYNVLVYKACLCLALDSLYALTFRLATANNGVYSIVKFVER